MPTLTDLSPGRKVYLAQLMETEQFRDLLFHLKDLDEFKIKPWRSGLTSEDWARSSGFYKGALCIIEILTGEYRD